jgi:hypothetical protein
VEGARDFGFFAGSSLSSGAGLGSLSFKVLRYLGSESKRMLKNSSKKNCFFKNIGAIIVLNKRFGLKDATLAYFPRATRVQELFFTAVPLAA